MLMYDSFIVDLNIVVESQTSNYVAHVPPKQT